MQDTSFFPPCQRRVGRAVVGSAHATVPVEILAANNWQTNGCVRVEPLEVGFKTVPRSIGGKREFARRATQAVRKAVT